MPDYYFFIYLLGLIGGVGCTYTRAPLFFPHLGRMVVAERLRSLLTRIGMKRGRKYELPEPKVSLLTASKKDDGLVDVFWRRRQNLVSLENPPLHYLVPASLEMEEVVLIRDHLSSRLKNNISLAPQTLWERLKSWILWDSSKIISLDGKFTRLPRSLGRRIVILGVHGWIPSKFLQTVVGLPRGTSTRLCYMMETNLREFIEQLPPSAIQLLGSNSPEITCFPLEGAGCIDERVDLHYAALTANPETLETLHNADTIIIVSHSQGAPVATLLAQRLIEEDNGRPPIIRPKYQNVLLHNLASVFHGPFPDLKSNLVVKYVEADAARELFDLNNPFGDLAMRLQKAINRLLTEDVLFCQVASWLDQVVPLYSALLLGFDHPNIWRCVYIDGHNYRSDFLTELVRFALRLTNAGIEEARTLASMLTGSLAGSLYQSNAHSTLYDDHDVYQVALHWAHTHSRHRPNEEPLVRVFKDTMQWKDEPNPYLIPWTMRGILTLLEKLPEESIRSKLLMEWEHLQNQLRDWKPEKKSLKELRLQMEPIKSKL